MLEDLPSCGECGRVRELLKLYQLASVTEETHEVVSVSVTEETCEVVPVSQYDSVYRTWFYTSFPGTLHDD